MMFFCAQNQRFTTLPNKIICQMRSSCQISPRQRNTQHTDMNTYSKTLRDLHKFFESLDCDLNHGLAAALAKKINAKTGDAFTSADIFREYESWQIED